MSADWRPAVFALLLLQAPLQAAEPDDEEPSDALLEFLGSFESEDGEWLDPLALAPAETGEAKRDDEDSDRDEA